MASRLSDCLVRDGTLQSDVLRAATARQAVYGGALDTALLELGALDETTLWTALATATGVPIPDAALFENPDPAAARIFDVAWSRRCHAVPVGQSEGTVQLCCSEPVEEAQLEAASEALGVSFELFVVPEVRLAAARQAVYGEPMPPRLLGVLARLLGAQPVRRWVKALLPARAPVAAPEPEAPAAAEGSGPTIVEQGVLHESELAEAEFDVPVNTYTTEPVDIIESRTSRGAAAAPASAADEVARALALGHGGANGDGPAPAVEEPPARVNRSTPIGRGALEVPNDENEEQLCRLADDPESEARLAALRVLRTRLHRPRVRALAEKLREDLAAGAERAILAAAALGELRDAEAVPALIAALDGPAPVARTAVRALGEIAQQDLGPSRKKWLAWWEQHKKSDRVTWLFEGLSHKSPEIRFSSSEELRLITGEYFGYHFDLPKRDREEAKARWRIWWAQQAKDAEGASS
jgi:Type II secretion system (T2SS), protein E, N-terminal domain